MKLRSVAVLLALLAPVGTAAQDPEVADRAWREGDTGRAERLYDAILAADSTHYAALHRVALLRAWSERYAESLALFDRMLRLYPDATDARVDRARVLAWRGDLDAAVAALQSVLDADPTNAAAIGALGQIQSWAGRHDDALRAYTRLEQLEPGVRSVAYDRARVLAWAERFEAAAAVYDSILAERPRDVDALNGLARTLLWAGMNDSAVVVFEALIDVEPGNAHALRGLAQAAAWSGNLKAAERHWRAALAADPADVEARVGLARTLRWQGRAAAGLEQARQAVAADPTSAEARDELRTARVAFAPSAAPAFAHEWDSDGNRMTTLSATGRFRPLPRVPLRIDAYTRDAREEGVVDRERAAHGATITGQLQIGVGWGLAASAGASTGDAGFPAVATYAVAASSPGREPLRGSVALRRQAFDATARLMEAGVVMTEIAADAALRAGERTELSAAGGLAWLEARQSGEDNQRWSAYASASHRLLPPLTFAATARAFGYERDLDDGYFDPDFFGLAEVLCRYRRPVGPIEVSIDGAPGLQRVGSGSDLEPVGRLAGAVTWLIREGRELAIGGVVANAGLDRLSAAEDSDYWYRAITARLAWSF